MSAVTPTIYVSPNNQTVCVDFDVQQHVRYKDASYSHLHTKGKDGKVYRQILFSSGLTCLEEFLGFIDTSGWTAVTQAPF
jgi:hypothetical protein